MTGFPEHLEHLKIQFLGHFLCLLIAVEIYMDPQTVNQKQPLSVMERYEQQVSVFFSEFLQFCLQYLIHEFLSTFG